MQISIQFVAIALVDILYIKGSILSYVSQKQIINAG